MTMAEYIEREALRDEILNDPTFDNDTINYYLDVVDSQPSADVVEVVRCKDCEHIHLIGKTPFAVRVCNHNKGLGDNVRENDFCSYGVKKEGD